MASDATKQTINQSLIDLKAEVADRTKSVISGVKIPELEDTRIISNTDQLIIETGDGTKRTTMRAFGDFVGTGLATPKEVQDARGNYPQLGDRLDAMDGKIAINEQNIQNNSQEIAELKAKHEADMREVIDARTDNKNPITTHNNLKERLDSDFDHLNSEIEKTNTQLSENAKKFGKYHNIVNVDNGEFVMLASGDQGVIPTRLYLVPKEEVTTGTGGCLKVFGDYFQKGNDDYRDCGIYFSSDQNSEQGYHKNGAFYINSKVGTTGKYRGLNPDIIISFQDNKIGQRWSYMTNQSVTNAWVRGIVGEREPLLDVYDDKIIQEIQKDTAYVENTLQRFYNTTGKYNYVRGNDNSGNYIIRAHRNIQLHTGYDITPTFELTDNALTNSVAIVNNSRLNVIDNSTTINVEGYKRIVLGQPSPTTITQFTGFEDGQEITLFVTNSNTTIEHNANIKLRNKANLQVTSETTVSFIAVGNALWQVN